MFFKRLKRLFSQGDRPLLKQFGDLTADDFEMHPVWIQCHCSDYGEPWYDDTDEETFRPWLGPLPAGPEEGMLLVKAKLTIADGRIFDGYLTPQHEGEPLHLGTIQPQMFLPSGTRCDFWDGMLRRKEGTQNILYDELAAGAETIFPIRFAVDLSLATGLTSGLIPGFCWKPADSVEIYF